MIQEPAASCLVAMDGMRGPEAEEGEALCVCVSVQGGGSGGFSDCPSNNEFAFPPRELDP